MQFTVLVAALLCTLAAAAPIPQDNAGSTSTSTTNNDGLLGIGLVGGKYFLCTLATHFPKLIDP